ncbi:uncharacterized protein [Pyxicephalus adspersus]
MAELNAAGPSDKKLLPESGTAAPLAKFPASPLMEDHLLPPSGHFLDCIDGTLYPSVTGTVEPFWNRNSLQYPTTTQYSLYSNLGGAYMAEPSRLLPGPQALPESEVTPFLTPTYCSNCKKMFATHEAYSRHEAMHTLGAKLFPCVECGKYYRHNTALVIHRRTHTGEKPYSCAECGRRFNARSSLVTHSKVHAGKKNCPECGKSFIRTDDLFHHQLIHNRERKFSCDDCSKCFKSECELTAHRRVHPTGDLFLCSGCGRDFTQYSKLLQHQKSHPQPPPILITKKSMLAD